MKQQYSDIDSYISDFPAEVQHLLQHFRSIIRKTVPQAHEVISYGIPTFKLKKNLVHFAGYKSHIGFYPGSVPIEHFKAQLKKYKTSKGAVQFPISNPLPEDLIVEITQFAVKEMESNEQ